MQIAQAPKPFAPVKVVRDTPSDLAVFEVYHPKKGTVAKIDNRMWPQFEKAGFRRRKA